MSKLSGEESLDLPSSRRSRHSSSSSSSILLISLCSSSVPSSKYFILYFYFADQAKDQTPANWATPEGLLCLSVLCGSNGKCFVETFQPVSSEHLSKTRQQTVIWLSCSHMSCATVCLGEKLLVNIYSPDGFRLKLQPLFLNTWDAALCANIIDAQFINFNKTWEVAGKGL